MVPSLLAELGQKHNSSAFEKENETQSHHNNIVVQKVILLQLHSIFYALLVIGVLLVQLVIFGHEVPRRCYTKKSPDLGL
jgi:hypothetical protein